MPIISACCCWDSLKTGSKASAIFTFATGVINIVIDIWMLVGLHHLASTLEQHEQFIFLPPGILVFGYVELAFNICSLALSLCLAVGVNRGYEGERLVFSWVYGIVGLRIYQFLLGVYVLVWLGSHRFNDIVFVVPEIIGISFYWLLDSIVLLAAVICVISYWQELINDLFGKERRVKYFKMLANLRSAAAGGGGAMTPSTRSYYPSRSMSRAASHGSIGGVGGAPPPTF
ncbi:hypothetical protein NP493_50g02036 [Ridgeia piscesae]|uniref:Transmembrane protein n=1 Tax=Ridgeia piscesae TaxID=27915 RepID=A0AAD9PB53_RIDPI|nr:hypothetical protein NP493_50g02036 [Ridgeia piscesae]